jgi:predicted acylesterase/phospholipase RssA
VLGGGAPNLTYMAGALAALDDRGVRFDVVSTSGAGMLIGLLYAAPRGVSRREALENTKNVGVHDAIYDLFPVNYKIFHKAGPWAELYTRMWQPYLFPKSGMGDAQRFLNDWAAFWCATFCPPGPMTQSLGMCQPAPWIEAFVDFEKVKAFDGAFYINAYNITDGKMEMFDKAQIDAAHFRAALAMPLIYAPYRLGGKDYIEGSVIDCLNYKGLLVDQDLKLDAIVVFDVLGREKLLSRPRNLYDAWVRSIVAPLVEVARNDTEIFELKHKDKYQLELLKVPFEIPDDQWPYVLDWSYSNAETLFDAGYACASRFFDEHKAVLAPKKGN